jgi:integrase
MKITKANINKLICPLGKDEVAFSDDEIDGLLLRARNSGARAWYYRYRDSYGRSRRLKLGDAKVVAPEEARDLARAAAREIAVGNSPVEKRKAARHAQSCKELFDLYLAHAQIAQRQTTLEATKRHLNRNAAPLANEPVVAITRSAIRAFKDKLVETTGPVQTNRTLATLSACWSWALRNGVIPEGDNPASYIDKFPEQPRERVLSMQELRAIWTATGGGSKHDRLVRFLMLTAARRAEGGGMAWSELSGDLWVVPSHRMKGGVSHEVVLPSIALEHLPPRDNHPFVFGINTPFSGWSGAKTRLNNALGFSDWGLHDFRRTFSTEMNSRELAQPHIIEATLAHIGAKSGVAGVYNTASFRPQKKAALLAWVKLLTDERVINAAS